MELKMEAYTPALELAGVLEIYRSVLWDEYAFQAGSFSVEALIAPESVSLLVPENILWIGGETAGIIESVQESVGEDGPYITVKGPLLTGLLARRILWGRYDLHGTVPALMYGLVGDCAVSPTRGDGEKRRLPGLALDGAPPAGGESIRKQKTGGSLLEALEELGEAHQTAFGVRFNPQAPQMEFWARRGVDRSVGQSAVDPVCLSTELDDVLSSEYVYDASEYKNVALVAGEGEGAERVMVTVNGREGEDEPMIVNPVLNENSWDTIRAVSEAGLGPKYWKVGDTKTIVINGKVGNITFTELSIDVFIIGFDHNAPYEGQNRIHWQLGRINNVDIALCDNRYWTSVTTEAFHMNSNDTNIGGWESSYMRTTLLGNNGTPDSPPADSLMSALPADLRAVMKPAIKYSDNIGGGSSAASNVTATMDYLFILAEYEVFGKRYFANLAEESYQLQYEYYAAGNPTMKYKHVSAGTSALWILRSAPSHGDNTFGLVHTNGNASGAVASLSAGLAPGFVT